jgi:uncharacterized protein (TIGR03435 family)
MPRLTPATTLIVAFSCCASAQPQAVPTIFDVATLKPNGDDDNRFALRPLPGGELSATGVPLKMLIMQAYNLKAFQISGEPDWVDTARWDIEAKVEGFSGRLSQAQAGTLLRALMQDRFQLKVRQETKEMPIYALVIGKGGSKLTPHRW